MHSLFAFLHCKYSHTPFSVFLTLYLHFPIWDQLNCSCSQCLYLGRSHYWRLFPNLTYWLHTKLMVMVITVLVLPCFTVLVIMNADILFSLVPGLCSCCCLCQVLFSFKSRFRRPHKPMLVCLPVMYPTCLHVCSAIFVHYSQWTEL